MIKSFVLGTCIVALFAMLLFLLGFLVDILVMYYLEVTNKQTKRLDQILTKLGNALLYSSSASTVIGLIMLFWAVAWNYI